MKLSFKTTTLIAAIGMIVYTVYVLTRYIIYQVCSMPPYHYDLWEDIRVRLIIDILPFSLIIAGIGLWRNRPAKEASKSFRIFTICLFVALVGTLVFSPLYAVRITGMSYLFPSIYWRAIVLISGIVWLFMLRNQPIETASPRSYRVTLIIAVLLLALPIVFEAISSISCFISGYVLGFSSAALKSWARWIAPTIVLTHLVFPQIKTINTTRNNHCVPGSFDESTFNRNRIVTLVAVGIAIAALCAGYICFFAEKRLYFREDIICNTIDDIACVCLCIAGVALFASWIMLSIMAFRQLPNPRGYKVYNIVCQCLVIGNIIAAVIVAMYMDGCSASSATGYLAPAFFLVVTTFIITTTIRVISYSLPK